MPNVNEIKAEVEALKKRAAQMEAMATKIEKANAAFSALGPAAKRVKIARDVLKQLKDRRILASSGKYLVGVATAEMEIYENGTVGPDPNQEVQDVIASMPSCEACALGSIFACAVSIADNFKLGKMENCSIQRCADSDNASAVRLEFRGRDLYRYLKRFFSMEQLSLIESAFERKPMGKFDYYGCDDPVVQPAVAFGRRYPSDKGRMVAIMKNIVSHRGEFRP